MVVPLLFMHLATPVVAGGMAAKLFAVQTWLSIVCGLVLLLMLQRPKKVPNHALVLVKYTRAAIIFVLIGMLLALSSEFVVAPHIIARENMKLWHGLGSLAYLLQWLCSGGVLWRLSGQSH